MSETGKRNQFQTKRKFVTAYQLKPENTTEIEKYFNCKIHWGTNIEFAGWVECKERDYFFFNDQWLVEEDDSLGLMDDEDFQDEYEFLDSTDLEEKE